CTFLLNEPRRQRRLRVVGSVQKREPDRAIDTAERRIGAEIGARLRIGLTDRVTLEKADFRRADEPRRAVQLAAVTQFGKRIGIVLCQSRANWRRDHNRRPTQKGNLSTENAKDAPWSQKNTAREVRNQTSRPLRIHRVLREKPFAYANSISC